MRLISLLIFLIVTYSINGQSPVITDVKVHFNQQVIENETEFVFEIKLYNKSNMSLFISPHPVFSSDAGNFGDVKIRVERLDSSCFKTLDIDEDPWGVKFEDYIKELKTSDSIIHRIDIRNYGFVKRGVYRLKIYYSYVHNGKKEVDESQWQFFEVKKYFPLRKPNLFHEERRL